MRHSQSGSLLIEALFSLLILLFGILAVVGLQAASTRSTVDSQMRTDASLLAEQLIATMWGDRANLQSYAVTGSAACSPTATTGVGAWVCRVQEQLPNATGSNSPVVSVTADGIVEITIRWQRNPDEPVRVLRVRSQIVS